MWVRAFDGIAWSDWDPFTLTTEPNAAPVDTIGNQGVHDQRVVTGASGWSTMHDADGDAGTRYQFYERGRGHGLRLFLDRRRGQRAANTYITVACRRPCHHLGARRVGDRLGIDVGARVRRHRLERWDLFTLTTGTPRRSATIDNQSAATNQWAVVRNWINA